jgi:Protein of unknown function (DUF2971)
MDRYFDFPPESALDADLSLRPLAYLDRRRAIRARRIPIPRHLFRYVSVVPEDKKSLDRLRDVLVRSRIWLSSPNAFNDPFDSRYFTQIPNDVSSVRAQFEKITLEKEPGLNYKQRKKRLEEMSVKLAQRPNGLRKVVDTAQEQVISQYGVACFSETPKSILMWSHYSAQHRGACLMFETSRDVKVWFRALALVYSEAYPLLEWRNSDEAADSKAIVSKFIDWAYERERRIVALNAANHYLRFNGESLTGVVLGCKADQPVVEAIQALAEERTGAGLPPLKLFRAVQSETKYELVIRREVKT